MYTHGMTISAPQKSNSILAAIKPVTKLNYRLNCLTSQLTHDDVIIEEPLQINLLWFEQETQQYQHRELAVIMRTPGQDTALVTGFLFTEGIIKSATDILSIDTPSDGKKDNQLEIKLAQNIRVNWTKLARRFTSQSSCGICGKTSIKSLALQSSKKINDEKGWLDIHTIPTLSEQLTKQQPLFNQTGGVHGAAIVKNTQWLALEEDVGRHNAVDKVIGQLLIEQHITVPSNNSKQQTDKSILLLTGRISFELIQKAVMAAIPVIIAIGAPSSLAISAAQQFNITLIGFIKNQQFNVYHGAWRLSDENEQ